MTQTRLIVILSAILLAVVAGSGILIFLLPSSSPSSTVLTTTDTTTATATIAPSTTTNSPITATGNTNFNTSIFQQSGYVVLDRQMIQDGRLPVQPPANTGKANPFL